jgi:sulfatase modifying factor 1
MGIANKTGYRIQIIVVLIGVAGVLGAAVISNWDKIFKETDRGPERPKVSAEEPESKAVFEEANRERLVKQQGEKATRQPKQGDIETNSIGMKLVYIPAGSFMMGSGDSAAQLAREYDIKERYFTNEFPQHQVRISKGFWMGQTEVTQGQYKSVMNAQPWSITSGAQEDPNNPAVYVSWDDAVEFCRKLSQQEGKTYRLPTEAKWEYACRAGTTTRFSFGDSESSLGDYAWYQSNTYTYTFPVGEKYAHPVGQKKPNPWGLYDMHGNVWEWCSDWFGEEYYSNSPSVDPNGPSSGARRSLRGGSWFVIDVYLRCSARNCDDPDHRYVLIGFRVVCSQ